MEGVVQNRPPYRYGGQTFSSLGAIEAHIKKFLDYYNRVVGEEKFDPVLADVIAERHYIWRHRGVRPTSFMFMANQAGDGRRWGDSLAGFFGPEWGWQRFSFHKAVQRDEPTMQSEFPRLCRERWGMVWRPRLFRAGTCEVHGCSNTATDVDHASPTHKEIEEQCWRLATPEDRATWWEEMALADGEDRHFGLSEGHPVTTLYDDLTGNGLYRLLCKDHHKVATKGALDLPGRKLWPRPEDVEIDIDAWF